MQVHYRLPNMGWHEDHTMDATNLWSRAWVNDQFLVSTEAEYDFLMGMSLMMGKELTLTWDPSMRQVGPCTTMIWIKSINTAAFNPPIRRSPCKCL